MTEQTPPSPWTAPPAPEAPAPPAVAAPHPSPIRDELARHDMLVSVGLGMLLGGGAILLLGALFVMLA